MILFTFGHTKDDKLYYSNKELRYWRWIFEVEKDNIGFSQQIQWERGGEWRDIRHYKFWYWPRHALWGEQHMYYDGPHCAVGLGYFQFHWDPDSCKKCEGEFPE